MRVYTYYTSYLLTIVIACARFTKHTKIELLNLALLGTSILHHAKYYEQFPGKMIVKTLDRILAHAVGLATMYVAVTHPNPQPILMIVYWSCLTWIIMLYHVSGKSHLPGYAWEPWHASVHVAGAMGQIALLCQTPKLGWCPLGRGSVS